jgi:hypothetical protein
MFGRAGRRQHLEEAPGNELDPKGWNGMFLWVVAAVAAPWVVLLGGVVAERWISAPEPSEPRPRTYERS